MSAIRKALNLKEKNPTANATGIMRFFSKPATREEAKTYWDDEEERARDTKEREGHLEEIERQKQKEAVKANARRRKQKSRALKREHEICSGVRAADGHKNKVRVKSISYRKNAYQHCIASPY